MDNKRSSGARVALITGGASGIGAAIASALGRVGFDVIVGDIDATAGAVVVDALTAEAIGAQLIELDVSSPQSIEQAFAQIEAVHGRCDVLVNCAGVARTAPFLDYPLAQWQRTFDVNVTGAMLCSQHAARLMCRARWGRIINIASVAGLRAVGEGRTAYGASKAALIGLTRQMAVELARHGVTANAICPGPVDTPLTQVLHSAQFRAEYTGAIPMQRYGTPEEMAHAVVFLASEGAGYVTGIELPVDGGFLAAGARPAAPSAAC